MGDLYCYLKSWGLNMLPAQFQNSWQCNLTATLGS